MVVKAIVVDLDGTVWDSRPFYAKLLCSVGTESTAFFLAKLNEGKNIVKLINETPNMGRTHFKRLCRENGKNIHIYPSVRETLSSALQSGIKIGVATNLPAWISQTLLEETGLNELVNTVVDASNCKIHKPNGRVLDILLYKLNTDAKSAVFAGDSIVDAMTARAAGVRFFWVSYGYEQPNQEHAYKVVNKLSEVLET